MKTIPIILLLAFLFYVGCGDDCRDLFDSIRTGDVARVKEIIENNDINSCRDPYDFDPLSLAVFRGNYEIFSIVIENFKDLDVTNNDGWTPLFWASINGRPNELRDLIEHGASVMKKDSLGMYPVSYAARNGHLECVQLLLDGGANPNIRGFEGMTPLILASGTGELEVVKFLLENGADPLSTTDSGENARDFARKGEFLDILALLEGERPEGVERRTE